MKINHFQDDLTDISAEKKHCGLQAIIQRADASQMKNSQVSLPFKSVLIICCMLCSAGVPGHTCAVPYRTHKQVPSLIAVIIFCDKQYAFHAPIL